MRLRFLPPVPLVLLPYWKTHIATHKWVFLQKYIYLWINTSRNVCFYAQVFSVSTVSVFPLQTFQKLMLANGPIQWLHSDQSHAAFLFENRHQGNVEIARNQIHCACLDGDSLRSQPHTRPPHINTNAAVSGNQWREINEDFIQQNCLSLTWF